MWRVTAASALTRSRRRRWRSYCRALISPRWRRRPLKRGQSRRRTQRRTDGNSVPPDGAFEILSVHAEKAGDQGIEEFGFSVGRNTGYDHFVGEFQIGAVLKVGR